MHSINFIVRVKPFSVGGENAASGKLHYGLMCSDYLSFVGEKTALCGASKGVKVSCDWSADRHTDL